MTDDNSTPRGFDIRTDTEAEKMTVQLQLRDSGDGWHTMSRVEASTLIDHIESAIGQLRKAENQRRMTPAKRARYREMLKAQTEAPLDETDLEELRELYRSASGAGIDVFDELAAAFEPGTAPAAPEPGEENHSDRWR